MKAIFVESFLVLTAFHAVDCCLEDVSHGVRLNDATFETIPDIGVHSCVKECLLRQPHCQSINYNTQQFQCEINNRDADIEAEGFLDTNYIFTNVVNVSREALGNCKNVSCAIFHKCIDLQTGSTCIATACPAGNYGMGGQCVPCPIGQYNGGNGLQWCLLCPVGTYQAHPGSSYCVSCPAGTYQRNEGPGQTSAASCIPCPAGSHQQWSGKTRCNHCAPGHYQPNAGQALCLPCNNGTVQHQYGTTSCNQCPAGSYQNSSGMTSCTYCAPGHYQPNAGQALCLPCNNGTVQHQYGTTSCNQCPAGSHQQSSGMTSCTHCAPGHYQPNAGQALCLPCNNGTVQHQYGTTSCNQCSGFYRCHNQMKTHCYVHHDDAREGTLTELLLNDLVRNEGEAGSYGSNHRGYISRNLCKQLCWDDNTCLGFTVQRNANPGDCYTHTSHDSYYNDYYAFFKFPWECH